jgi:hypothetical protein
MFIFPYGIVGPPLGAMFGAIVGLPLGLLEGAVLGALTMLRYRRGALGDPLAYRRAAQLACVAMCVVAVATFWVVVFLREGDFWASVRVVLTRQKLETFILVIGPLLIAAGASWWASRRVAGRYAQHTAAG